MSTRFSILIVWIAVIGLLGLGLVMVTSTSPWTPEGSDYGMLYKQGMFAIAGVLGALALAIIDYRRVRPYVWWIFGFAVLLLSLCYVPGIGKELNGEYRWIEIGFRFQPSECAKIVIMLALAYWYTEHKDKIKSFFKGFVIPMAILGLPLGLIFFEKDMGTAAALGVAGFCVMFVAGTRPLYLAASALLAGSGFFYLVTSNQNRLNRIIAFIDLEAHKLGFGLQQWRALMALSNGGVEGVGLGNSAEKHGYLPYAHTDFIFAPLGEELGLYGTLGVLLAFCLIAIMGVMIALQTRDMFGRLLAIGIVFIIFWPAVLNIAVVTGCLPNTGLPLPFISYGGTNLVFTLAAIGILTSIQRWSTTPVQPFVEPVLRRNPTPEMDNIRL